MNIWTGWATLLGLLGMVSVVTAQGVLENGCLRLLGSVACPGFSFAYLSPGNLSNAFPFFEDVSDVRSFDAAALNYFSNPFQWQTTKFTGQLGCFNASDAVLRFQRTVLCSNWVNSQWSRECLALYNGTTAATSQKMVCQSTCLDFAASENELVNNTLLCPGPDLTNGGRAAQLEKDFVDCTNWTTLATNNSETCVSGYDNGEGNCGFGSSTVQLCAYCSGDQPDECCYASNTDMSVCGFALAPRPSTSSSESVSGTSTSSSAQGSGTLQPGNEGTGSSRLSGGQLAGTIVGSVLGGLLILALLLLLLLCLRRRRRQQRDANSVQGNAPVDTADRGMFASIFPSTSRHGKQPNNSHSSEKGLLGHGGAAAASSPTMGGDTLYSAGKGASTDAGLGMGGAAGAAAAFGAGGPGMRNSGVVLPRVKDENQSGDRWIETGAEVHVLWPYQAALPDELDLRPGMKLKVLRLYDDAWGTAVIVSGGEGDDGKQGAFPIVCVSEGSSLGSSRSASEEST